VEKLDWTGQAATQQQAGCCGQWQADAEHEQWPKGRRCHLPEEDVEGARGYQSRRPRSKQRKGVAPSKRARDDRRRRVVVRAGHQSEPPFVARRQVRHGLRIAQAQEAGQPGESVNGGRRPVVSVRHKWNTICLAV
jgi:hypothetical protein